MDWGLLWATMWLTTAMSLALTDNDDFGWVGQVVANGIGVGLVFWWLATYLNV